MLKKYNPIVFFILLTSMLAVGCTGSNNEKTAYQDDEWNESFHNNLALLHTDFNNSYNAMDITDNLSDISFVTSAQNIIDDSQNALNEKANLMYLLTCRKYRKSGLWDLMVVYHTENVC